MVKKINWTKLSNYYIFSVIWGIIILILSGIPGSSAPKISFLNIPYSDKILHASFYFILAFLILTEKSTNEKLTLRRKIFVIIIATIYGILIEILQKYVFIQRTSETLDAICNMLGAALSAIIFERTFKLKNYIITNLFKIFS